MKTKKTIDFLFFISMAVLIAFKAHALLVQPIVFNNPRALVTLGVVTTITFSLILFGILMTFGSSGPKDTKK